MSSTTGPGAAFALVRQRNFGPYFFGNALSASGGWFQNLAASLLVYRLTHSPFLLGLLNFCQFIPVLVPAQFVLVPRLRRRAARDPAAGPGDCGPGDVAPPRCARPVARRPAAPCLPDRRRRGWVRL